MPLYARLALFIILWMTQFRIVVLIGRYKGWGLWGLSPKNDVLIPFLWIFFYCRRHFLQFPQGTLGKHFQKLIQCDPRLSFLSQQPQIVLDTPYFQPRVSIFGDKNGPEHGFEFKTEGRFSFSGIRDTISVSGLSSSDIESQNPIGSTTNSHQPIPGIIWTSIPSFSSYFCLYVHY